MKTNTQLTLKIAAILAIALLTACGTTKSSPLSESSVIEVSGAKALASCHRLNDSNFSMNIANVKDTSNQINPDWIKVKFQFLSADMTQTGYNLKFYKWRVIGAAAQLDSNPLEFNAYTLSNGQSTSNAMTGIFTTQINMQNGFYIRLNDDTQYPYQVLKVVVYKTDGTVAAQANVLIPQFLASPIDYKTNPDGSARADILQQLHPLYAVDTTGWAQSKLQQNFDQYCF